MTTKAELEKSKAELKELLTGGPYTAALELAVDAIDARLAQMKAEEPDVWVPPDGMIVECRLSKNHNWVIGRSKGKVDSIGLLQCYSGTDHDRLYEYWRRIPNLIQLTPHDGSPDCPCEDRPTIVFFKGKLSESVLRPELFFWEDVVAYCYLDDFVLEGK